MFNFGNFSNLIEFFDILLNFFWHFWYPGCIAHICVDSISLSKRLFDLSRAVGFRNSGISIGANAKFTVQIRGCNALEVPLSLGPNLLVSDDFIRFLVATANEKFDKNQKLIDKLVSAFRKELEMSWSFVTFDPNIVH